MGLDLIKILESYIENMDSKEAASVLKDIEVKEQPHREATYKCFRHCVVAE